MSDINQILDQLKKNAMEAISQDRTDEGLLLLGYHDQLQVWQKNEFAGQAPVSVARLQEWGIEPPDDWPAAAANTTDGDRTAPEDSQADFSQELARGHRLLKQKNFSRARDLFDKIGREAAEETTRAEAEAYARQAEKERSAALAAIVAKAEEHDRKQAADFKGRLDKWQKVQKKAEETDPEFSLAREKIKEIENLEVVKKAEQQINDLAEQLPKIKDELDLLGAKNVLLNVKNLSEQYGDQPVLKSRLDDLLRQLNGDEYEQGILTYIKETTGVGATEIQSGRWLEAYQHYRGLRDANVKLAFDPRDGQEKPVNDLYREACEGLAKFITDKVGDRAETAEQAFNEMHNLELALDYSDEALAFVKEHLPPQFPDDLRIQVESLRDAVQKARRPYELKLKDWQTAKVKFLEAVRSDDNNQALKFLDEVEVHWPKYPKLNEERQKRRHSLAGLFTRRLQNICAEAEDLTKRQEFQKAQHNLKTIIEEASVFPHPNQSLKESLQQARSVLKNVREREPRYKAYQSGLMFNLKIWQDKTSDSLRNLGTWLDERGRKEAPLVLYGYLSALALLPLALAGDPTQALVAVGGVFGGVGGGLVANKVEQWAKQAGGKLDAAALAQRVVEAAPQDPELRQEIDTVLQKLEVVSQAQAGLRSDQQVWFRRTLRAELQQLGNLERFVATLSGKGALAQGEQARAAYAESGGTAMTGDVHGNLTINQGRPAPDRGSLREAYLNRLLEKTGFLSLTGIDRNSAGRAQPEARLDLSAVYTALLTASRVELAELERSKAALQEERISSALAMLDSRARLVLLGDPGSGKSTFVNFVAMCLAGEILGHKRANLALLTAPLPDDKGNDQEQRQPWQHGPLLPVPVTLRDFAARGLPPAGEPATAEHLWRFIAAELKSAALTDFVKPLAEELLNKGGLLLLDGLDEVPEADQRRTQIKQAVTDFAGTFKKCRIVVTSRTYAYQQQDWRLPGFQETVLTPFSAGQMRRFVSHWYSHVAELRGMHPDDAQGRAELLKQAIFGSDRLRSLAERPLLLTLMASLHAWRGGSLPEKREELYADTVDLLLDWWESPKIVKDAQGRPVVLQPSLAEWLQVDRDRVRQLLNKLAFEAHTRQPELTGTADVPEGELVGGLLRLSRNPDARPGRLVEYLSQRAGLLLPRGVGVYTFPHRTFQEYLAACHLTDADYPDQVAELARQDPNRWREVALLAGAKASRGATASLWQLVEALCYRDPAQAHCEAGDEWGGLLAGQALVELADLSQVSERHQPKVDRVRRWAVAILEKGRLPAVERAAAGVILAHVGDPRPGVGLRADGLPDIRWCEVPAGPFVRGSKDDKLSLFGKETPQREVVVPAFRISRYPVTNAQFAAFVADGGYTDKYQHCWTEAGWQWKGDRQSLHKYGTPYNYPNHPVVGVTWYEAAAFCRWLTDRLRAGGEIPAGAEISLPSESQWEKAARGSDGRRYPWGNEADPDRANYDETGIGATSAVGCFSGGASPYGVEEMSGNVWEWCRTKFEESYENYRDDNNLEGDARRVVRGGAFLITIRSVRCACRGSNNPYLRGVNLGFRVLVSPFS